MYSRRCFYCLSDICSQSSLKYSTSYTPFKLDKILLLQKLSRLEIEQFRQPELSEQQLEKDIAKRGLDYGAMLKHHKINRAFQDKVCSVFENFGITTRTVNRFNYTESNIDWCDAVFPIGGDGTFLLGASRIPDSSKPVVGFNSDPGRSEGHLCLPTRYSKDIRIALEKLKEGRFKWMFRTRIRVSFSGESTHQIPIELHEQALRFKLSDLVDEERRRTYDSSVVKPTDSKRRLPVLALNEVFLGEILSAKVSYFEMRLNGCKKSAKVKSSGLCVCTGTGSTSWNMSINRLTRQDVREILELYTGRSDGDINEDTITKITDTFNQKFKFYPEDQKLGYTIRDLISVGVWPKPKGVIEPRGFAETIEVKSRCSDAGLVIDGGISFPFNDGTVTLLETYSEDALRTVVLCE